MFNTCKIIHGSYLQVERCGILDNFVTKLQSLYVPSDLIDRKARSSEKRHLVRDFELDDLASNRKARSSKKRHLVRDIEFDDLAASNGAETIVAESKTVL